jgi:hypothetical protein
MRRLAPFLVLLIAPWCSAQEPATTAESLPLVRPVKGELLLWRASESKTGPVSKETRIGPADRLSTRDGDYAAFSTEAGTIVALKGVRSAAERGLGIERRAGKLTFRIFEGKVVVQSFDEGVTVETPQGQIVATGSRFLVEVDKDNRVVVKPETGEVTFTNSLGSVVVGAGKETVVEPGKKPTTPKGTDLAKGFEEFNRFEASSNLLKNPGFEDGFKEWDAILFAATGKKQAELDTASVHSGKACARFDVGSKLQGAKGGWGRFLSQNVAVEVGKTYLFRAFVRSEIREGQVVPKMFIYNSDLKEAWKFPAEKAWRMVTGRVVAKEKHFVVSVEANVASETFEGSFWVDDFFLSELPAPVKSK